MDIDVFHRTATIYCTYAVCNQSLSMRSAHPSIQLCSAGSGNFPDRSNAWLLSECPAGPIYDVVEYVCLCPSLYGECQ